MRKLGGLKRAAGIGVTSRKGPLRTSRPTVSLIGKCGVEPPSVRPQLFNLGLCPPLNASSRGKCSYPLSPPNECRGSFPDNYKGNPGEHQDAYRRIAGQFANEDRT